MYISLAMQSHCKAVLVTSTLCRVQNISTLRESNSNLKNKREKKKLPKKNRHPV